MATMCIPSLYTYPGISLANCVILNLSSAVYCWWCPLHVLATHIVLLIIVLLFLSLFMLDNYCSLCRLSLSSLSILTWQYNKQYLKKSSSILCCKSSMAWLTIWTIFGQPVIFTVNPPWHKARSPMLCNNVLKNHCFPLFVVILMLFCGPFEKSFLPFIYHASLTSQIFH